MKYEKFWPLMLRKYPFLNGFTKNVLIDNIAHDSKTFAEIIQTAQTLKLSDSAKNNLELSADAKFSTKYANNYCRELLALRPSGSLRWHNRHSCRLLWTLF